MRGVVTRVLNMCLTHAKTQHMPDIWLGHAPTHARHMAGTRPYTLAIFTVYTATLPYLLSGFQFDGEWLSGCEDGEEVGGGACQLSTFITCIVLLVPMPYLRGPHAIPTCSPSCPTHT